MTGNFLRTAKAARLAVTGFIYLFATQICLCSCVQEQSVFTVDVNPLGWDVSSPACIHYDNYDSLSVRTINLLVRTDGQITASSMKLEIETATPDSLRTAETVEITLPPAGRGFAETKLTYRIGVVLGRKGRYTFTVRPTEGSAAVEGVAAVGLEIFKQEAL